MKSRPKRHHYVPEFLLTRFVLADGLLHIWRKSDGHTWAAVPNETFVIGHLYSAQAKDGSRDPALEEEYSILEGHAAIVVEKIAGAANVGAVPALTEQERRKWDEFFFHQIVRVQEFMDELTAVSEFEDRLKILIPRAEAAVGRKLKAAEKVELQQPDVQARIKQNATVRSLADPGDTVTNRLATMGLQIGVCSGQARFVIGSQPVTQVPLGDVGGARSFGLWLPLGPGLAVRPFALSVPEQLIPLDDATVDTINDRIVRQSAYVASGSLEHLLAVCGGATAERGARADNDPA